MTNAEKIIGSGLYEAAVELMDDDLREDLHRELVPCTDLEFLEAYIERHREKFGEEFTI